MALNSSWYPLITILSCFYIFSATATEFQVGGDDGWIVPKHKSNDQRYNLWASENRFKVGDAVHFKYDNDSVMVVTAEEYAKCWSTRPVFFANNGDTTFNLEQPGSFYFISGVAGHCQKGQKMIIEVLEPETQSPVPSHENQTATPKSNKNAAFKVGATFSFPLWVTLLAVLHFI